MEVQKKTPTGKTKQKSDASPKAYVAKFTLSEKVLVKKFIYVRKCKLCV